MKFKKYYLFLAYMAFATNMAFSQTQESNIQAFVGFAQAYLDNLVAKGEPARMPNLKDIERFNVFDKTQKDYYSFQYFYDLYNVGTTYDNIVHGAKDKSFEAEYVYYTTNFNVYLAEYFLTNQQNKDFDRKEFETWFLRLMRNHLQNIWYNHGSESEPARLELAKSVSACLTNAWAVFSSQSKLQLWLDVSVHTEVAVADMEQKALAAVCTQLKNTIEKFYTADKDKKP